MKHNKLICTLFIIMVILSSCAPKKVKHPYDGFTPRPYTVDSVETLCAMIQLYREDPNADAWCNIDSPDYYEYCGGDFTGHKVQNIQVLYVPKFELSGYELQIDVRYNNIEYTYMPLGEEYECEESDFETINKRYDDSFIYRVYRQWKFDTENELDIMKKKSEDCFSDYYNMEIKELSSGRIYVPEKRKIIFETYLNTRVELTVPESYNTEEQILQLLEIELVVP